MPNDDKNKKEQQPHIDDLKGIEELNRLLQPERSKGVSRTNGVIAIIAGIGFLCVAAGCSNCGVFRILPLIGGIGFIAMGISRLGGND